MDTLERSRRHGKRRKDEPRRKAGLQSNLGRDYNNLGRDPYDLGRDPSHLDRDFTTEPSVDGSRSPSRPRFIPSRARFLRFDRDFPDRDFLTASHEANLGPDIPKSRSVTEISDRDLIAPAIFRSFGSDLARSVLWKIAGYKRKALNNFQGSASFLF